MLCTIRSYGQGNEEILLSKENAKPKQKNSKFCSSTYRQVVADFWLLWPDLVCRQPPTYQFSEVGGTSPSLKVFYVRQNKLEPSLGRFGKIRAVKGNLEALWGSAVALPPLGGQLAVVGVRGGQARLRRLKDKDWAAHSVEGAFLGTHTFQCMRRGFWFPATKGKAWMFVQTIVKGEDIKEMHWDWRPERGTKEGERWWELERAR